jgi:putative ABC transport system substrate-binding protein
MKRTSLPLHRRDFITLLRGAAFAWPLAGRAQQPKVSVIGYLSSGSPDALRDRVAAFQRGLNESGFVEGRNVAIEYRWADNQYDRLPELAADLLRQRVTVIIAPGGLPATRAARALTATIRIVFSTSTDPVQAGVVASLNRPGGNVTGVTDMSVDLAGKQLGLLHELLPGAARFALLVNPGGGVAEPTIAEAQAAASAIGKPIEVLRARTNSEIDAAFASTAQKGVDALLIGTNVLFNSRRTQLAVLAARYRMPTMYPQREYTVAGGLMSYGPSLADRERQLGLYAGRILKGENPSDLPVVRASKFEFVMNLQTAKAIGIEVPPTLLVRTDEVIE